MYPAKMCMYAEAVQPKFAEKIIFIPFSVRKKLASRQKRK
uniref:Uncharacterized protein n=2 Tax=unclassified Salmonella TaxID=2614656 RepID=I3W3M5_9ENTR|nr:hypothetical protein [Salmonella sp. 14]AFK90202.1 hypothetical protein [Salmonella sp. 40]